MRIPTSLGIATLAVAAVLAMTARAAAPAYAPVKKRICQPCHLPAIAVFLPKHGVLLARRGTFSFGATYYAVDLDSGQIVKYVEPADSRTGAARPMHLAFKLKPDDSATLIELMNKLWAEPAPLKPTGATDVYWDAWLADGKDVRYEHGPGNPPGAAEALENELLRLMGNYERIR